MNDELTAGDLKRIERLLKRDMARHMNAIQEDRTGPPGGDNIATASDYVETARTLRRVLLAKGRQSWVPVRDMIAGDEWVNDTVAETAEIGGADTVAEVAEKLHRVRNPHFPPRTLTDHDGVPGKSA